MIDKNIKLLKILVVAGGWSDEREVSLMSGRNVFSTLKRDKFNVIFLDIKKNNIDQILIFKPDIIFNSLHGEFGEDGGINSYAKKNNILITHSGAISSALCFNKRLLKHFLKKELNILSPKEIVNKNKIKLPVISKPNWGGSSNGIKFLNNMKELTKKINNHQNLIEEIIYGKELTVTVIENNNKIISLGVTEIEFENKHYDYIAKYTKNKSFHFLPARIPKLQYDFLMKISKKIFRVCGCKGIARLDFIMSQKNGKIYFLEMNTHPGLTKLSLAPEQANYLSLSYLNLLKKILRSSL
ncbi:D-alanine--D-alanine ligase [Alphaproteobacteria bacterium]|nr:D-alanine--D-alanine ligase [Alphaproteobacteria bacterium]